MPTVNINNNNFFDSNSWLSGFIDAEGCFDITVNKYPRIRFRLEQTLIGYETLFKLISEEFN